VPLPSIEEVPDDIDVGVFEELVAMVLAPDPLIDMAIDRVRGLKALRHPDDDQVRPRCFWVVQHRANLEHDWRVDLRLAHRGELLLDALLQRHPGERPNRLVVSLVRVHADQDQPPLHVGEGGDDMGELLRDLLLVIEPEALLLLLVAEGHDVGGGDLG
jgi:hypothetical protein